MKKLLALILILLFSVTALAEAPKTLPDFTVTTVDGETLTLSELLETKDLVILNIFTSWCPPCRQEFPMIEYLYEQNADRMAVVALSAEPNDTYEVLVDYRDELGLTFPIGRIAGTGVESAVPIEGYPTSVFLTKGGAVGFFQLGAFTTYFQLEGVAGHMLAEDYDGNRFAFYGVYCYDENDNPVEGVTVGFCTDELCVPVTSNAYGQIVYTAEPGEYHLQVLKVPDGYADPDFDVTTAEDGGWTLLPLAEARD